MLACTAGPNSVSRAVQMATVPDVFIIESLGPDDEGNGRFEGSIISNMLRFHGKNPRYRYVRTREEFEGALIEFGQSNYRYLHLSAHGDKDGMITTNLDEIDFDELSDLLKPHLEEKRLFLSACSMVHEDFAAHLIPNTRCYSVIGPDDDVEFHKAAIFWASVYHLMFSVDSERFTRLRLKEMLGRASHLFDVRIRYFSRFAPLKKGYREDVLQPEREPNRRVGSATKRG